MLRRFAQLSAVVVGCVLAPIAFSQTNVCSYPEDKGGAVVASPAGVQTTLGNYEVWAASSTGTRFTLTNHSWDIFEHVTSQPLSQDPGSGKRTTLAGTWYTFQKGTDYTTSNMDTYPTWYVIQPTAPGTLLNGSTWTTPLIKVTYSGKFNDQFVGGAAGSQQTTQAGTVTLTVVPNPTNALYDGSYLAMEVDYGYPTVQKTVNYCLSLFDTTPMGSTSPAPGAPFVGLWGGPTPGSASSTYQVSGNSGYQVGLVFFDERLSGGTWSGQPVWGTAYVAASDTALTPSASSSVVFVTKGAPWDCISVAGCGSWNPTMPVGANSASASVSFGTSSTGPSLNAGSVTPGLVYPSTAPPYPDATSVEWNSSSAISLAPLYCSALIDATPAGSTATDSFLGCPDSNPPAAFSTCTTASGATTCPVSVRWRIVDGYPNATVFAIDTNADTTTAIAASGALASTGTTYNMPAGASYRFEVHTGTAASSPVVARSQVVTASSAVAKPTCTSEAPAAASTPPGATTQRIYAYGVQNATKVYFPTWWIASNPAQKDIQWLQGTSDGNGQWHVDVVLSQYDADVQRYGAFETDVYMSNANFTNVACGGGSWTRQAPAVAGLPPLEPEVTDAVPTHDAKVGTMAGQADTSGGAATYTVPIVVPPGRAGMQPAITLSYSSRGGNGPLGMGWSVSAASSIHRCPQTPEQDGQSLAVTYTMNDRLCLDGQRLVAVSGSYGASGTIYRTEVDSYARVTQVGGDLGSTDTACFRVEQKDGRILHFGGVTNGNSCAVSTVHSRVKPFQAGAALSWMVEKIEDRVGNNQLYAYAVSDASGAFGDGEVLLSTITYTGYSPTGAVGDRSVTFTYQPRTAIAGVTDVSSSYLMGGRTLQTRALLSIATSVAGNTVRTYTPSYTALAYSGRLAMTDLTECATAGGSTACHPPTHFDLNDAALGTASNFALKSLQALHFSPDNSQLLLPYQINVIGDLDGDGTKEALVTVTQTNGKFDYLVQMTADRVFHNPLDVTSILGNIPVESFADVDGSGRSSAIISANDSTGANKVVSIGVWNLGRGTVATSNPLLTVPAYFTGTTQPVTYPNQYLYGQKQLTAAADFDGDGKIDLVFIQPDASCGSTALGLNAAAYFYRNRTSGLLSSSNPAYFDTGKRLFCLAMSYTNAQAWTVPTIDHVADFDGDGLPDFFLTIYGTSGTSTPVSGFAGIYVTQRAAGVLTASAFRAPGSVLTCTTDNTTDECNWAANNFATRWMDVNGDGLDDFVYARPHEPGGPVWRIRLNQGNGAFAPSIAVSSNGYVGLDTYLPSTGLTFRYASRMPSMDVDSDGKPDLLIPRASDTTNPHDYRSFAMKVCSAVRVTVNGTSASCPSADGGGIVSGGSSGTPDNTSVQCVEYVCPENPGTNTLVLPPNNNKLDQNSKYEWGALSAWGSYSGGLPGADETGLDLSIYYLSMVKFVQTGPQQFSAKVIETPMVSSLDSQSTDLFGDGLADVITTVGCSSSSVSVPSPPGNGSYPNCAVVGTFTDGVTYGPTTFPDGTPTANFVGNRAVYANVNQGVAVSGGSSPGATVGTPTPPTITASANALSLGLSPPILPGLLAQTRNGLGDLAQWGYAPLSTPATQGSLVPFAFYQPGGSYADSRHFYVDSSMPVVYGMNQSTGVGGLLGFRSEIYGYNQGLYNHFGRGFQGFYTITDETATASSNVNRRVRTVTRFNQRFPLTGKVGGVVKTLPGNGNALAHNENLIYRCMTLANGTETAAVPCTTGDQLALPTGSTVYQPLLSNVGAYDYDPTLAPSSTDPDAGSEMNQVITNNTWDTSGYGNLVSQTVTRSDLPTPSSPAYISSHVTTITNTYSFMSGGATTGCSEPVNSASWWINELCQSVVNEAVVYDTTGHPLPTGVASPGSQQVTTLFTYNNDRSPATKTVQASGANSDLSTRYTYPATSSMGLPQQVQVCLGDFVSNTCSSNSALAKLSPTRTTAFTYTKGGTSAESDGYFVYQATQTVSGSSQQSTTTSHQPSDGQVTAVDAPNGTQTTTSFDPFGRVTQISYLANDNSTYKPPLQMAYTACSNGTCSPATGANYGEDGLEAYAAYKITTVQKGYPTQVAWYDLLGREVKTAQRGYLTADPFIETVTYYDRFNTIADKFVPFYQNASAQYFTSWAYDALNRPMLKVSSRGASDSADGDFITRYKYTGRKSTVSAYASNQGTYSASTDSVTCNSTAANQCIVMSRFVNGMGQFMRTVDANGGVTDFWTEPMGHFAAITDPEGNTMQSSYNALGQRTQSIDPDQGTWNFTYDALDELLTQTDARQVTTSITQRDGLGRMLQRKEVPASTSAGLYNESVLDEWVFDGSTGCSTLNCIGQLATASRWRAAGTTAPSDTGTAKWSEAYTYDSAGRASTTTTTINEGSTVTLGTSYGYDADGRASTHTYPSGFTSQIYYAAYGVRGAIGGSGAIGWEAKSMDVWGKVTSDLYWDGTAGTYSTFADTGQESTASWTLSSATVDSLAYTYDSFQNLKTQTRGAPGQSGTVQESYVYDGLQRLKSTARPGASVSYSYTASGNISSKSDYANTYTYAPAMGKVNGCGPHAVASAGSNAYLCDANGNVYAGALSLQYDAENHPRTAERGSGAMDTWAYDVNGNRYYESTSRGLRYFGPGGYEQLGTMTMIHELGPFIVTRIGATDSGAMVLRDRLGSTIETIDNGKPAANLANSRAYDAFGKVRSGNMADLNPAVLNLADTIHGFTQHEQVDDVQILHMGGRVYDYGLGRFLNVDPIIGNALNSQSLNPYSYIGNNPLSGVDPTGYATQDAPEIGTLCGAMAQASGCGGVSTTQVGSPSLSEHNDAVAASLSAQANHITHVAADSGAVSMTSSGAGGAKNAQASPADQGALTNAPASRPGEQNPYNRVLESISIYSGQQLADAATVRENYIDSVSKLDPSDSAGRKAIKEDAREQTPKLIRDLIESRRPSTDARPGTGGTANASNPNVNALGRVFKVVGRGLIVAGAVISAYDIATSDDRPRAVARQGGAWAGALTGGGLGAYGGSFILPGWGTAVGGIVGSIGGSFLGEEGVDRVYNYFVGPKQ